MFAFASLCLHLCVHALHDLSPHTWLGTVSIRVLLCWCRCLFGSVRFGPLVLVCFPFASGCVSHPVCVLSSASLLLSQFVYPTLNSTRRFKATPLRKMAFGMVCTCLAFVCAALVEAKINASPPKSVRSSGWLDASLNGWKGNALCCVCISPPPRVLRCLWSRTRPRLTQQHTCPLRLCHVLYGAWHMAPRVTPTTQTPYTRATATRTTTPR